MWIVLGLLACGTPNPESLSSTPVAPTVDMNPEPEAITWSSLEGLFKKGDVAYPPVLAALKIGQSEAEARAALTAAAHHKFPRPDEVEVKGILAIAAVLEGYHEAAVTLLVFNGTLREVDLGLPGPDAAFLTEMAWGPPQGLIPGENPVPDPIWTHGDLTVRLMVRGEHATLKYTATGAAPLAPQTEE